ncbi:MAG: glycosyltransferase, partial [Anaerolineae bacterium]|nr:glycosyltransferase [Anaerolineae bacterium]
MIRVLHLTPALVQGGVERHLATLAPALGAAFGQHVAVIHPTWLLPPFFDAPLRAAGIPITYLEKPVGKWGRLPLLARYLRLVRTFRPHIVHAHQPEAMRFARIVHSRLARQTRLVLTSHDLLEDPLDQRWERRLIDIGDAIVAVSEGVQAQYLAQYPSVRDRLVLIPHGIEAQAFAPGSRHAARARLGIPPEVTLGLMPARYATKKNHLGLLAAVQALQTRGTWPPQGRLLCLGGNSDPPLLEDLRRLLAEHPALGQVVELREGVPNILDFYHACDFVVLPSHYEGFGLVLAEAAAAARPALVTPLANVARFVLDEVTGWEVPLDGL